MPSHSIDKTSVKLFLGEKSDISHIRVFESKVYLLVPKQKRKKWDNKAEEGVLVGYDGNTKDYRILNPKTNRIWISHSVRIIEHDDKQSDRYQTSQGKEAYNDEAGTSRSINYEPPEQKKIYVNSESEKDSEKEHGMCDENYETSNNTITEIPHKRVTQRTNKGVVLHKLYKVQTNSVRE